jgi:hypothetical protein
MAAADPCVCDATVEAKEQEWARLIAASVLSYILRDTMPPAERGVEAVARPFPAPAAGSAVSDFR